MLARYHDGIVRRRLAPRAAAGIHAAGIAARMAAQTMRMNRLCHSDTAATAARRAHAGNAIMQKIFDSKRFVTVDSWRNDC